jgi:hypothetical protein
MRIYCETFALPPYTPAYCPMRHGAIEDELGWAIEDIDEHREAGNATRTANAVGRAEGLITALYAVGALDSGAWEAACTEIRTALIGGEA